MAIIGLVLSIIAYIVTDIAAYRHEKEVERLREEARAYVKL